MSESTAKGKNASELFPGLIKGKPAPSQEKSAPKKEQPAAKQTPTIAPRPDNELPKPPSPPDISWLLSGELREKARNTDIPSVLVLIKNETVHAQVEEVLKDFDYQIDFADSAEQAIHKTKHQTPSIIIVHAEASQESSDATSFHNYMSWLPMSKRRNSLYILISAKLKTLYNLEALTYSANIVVNEKDVEHLAVIIRKGMHEHKQLFGPLTEAMRLHAK